MGAKKIFKNGGLEVLHHSLIRDSNKHLCCQFSCRSPSPPSRKSSLGIVCQLLNFIWGILFSRGFRSFHFHHSRSSWSSTEAEIGLKPRKFCVAEPLPPAGFPWSLLSPAVPTEHRPDPSSPCCQQGLPICESYSKNPKIEDGRWFEEMFQSHSSVSVLLCWLFACAFPSCAIQVELCGFPPHIWVCPGYSSP